MRGHITRRFHITIAEIGFYDMEKNTMISVGEISGDWKTTDQVLKYVKKNRDRLEVPKDKQATVLSMHVQSELRKMTYSEFYANSTLVEEKKESKETKQTTKSKRKK